MQTQTPPEPHEAQGIWVRILKKGIVTLPKLFREKTGIKEGDVAKARLVGNSIVIEPREEIEYRLFTDEEIKRWREDEVLSPELTKEAEDMWSDIP